MYVSTDIPDQCGAITIATARSIPSERIAMTASGIEGGECFMPRYGLNPPPADLGSSRAAVRSACRRVISRSGNLLPWVINEATGNG